MRFALLVSMLFAFVACIGSLEEKYPVGQDPDAPDAAPAACDELATPPNGHHNEGQACLGCHTGAGGIPAFTVGGTLYSDAAGTAPVAGATIHLVDANQNDVTIVTADNGNFWTTQTLVFPVTTHASLCPDTARMFTPLDQTGGDCNSSGCHAGTFRVHVP